MKNINDYPISERRDLAFQSVVALRDAISIAKKKGLKPTYEKTINLFNDFSPELYESIIQWLPQRNLSDEAKVFIAKAEGLTEKLGKVVTPLEMVQEEINILKGIIKDSINVNPEKKKTLRGKIGSLEGLKKSLKPRELTENRILNRDISRANREDFGAKFINETDFYVDYELSKSKFLRIRMLHPDKPEHITGADLIYEQHNEENGKIRVAFLQYKIWENGVLHLSSVKNLQGQLDRLKKCLCDGKFCEKPDNIDEQLEYRLPYCCAFLRPTDKLQEQNEKLVSTGIHIPICAIPRLKEIDGNKIERKHIRFQTITHEIFEYLFNREFIGSRWLDEFELEDFYKKNKILQSDESIIFYAREIKTRE